MPTSLLSTDTMFPNFKGNETTEEKVDQIQNYLYMLVEQLRYSMANVGKENFNETEFDNIVNLITEPVYLQLKNETGDINSYVQATAENLSARITGISDLLGETQQTTTELTASLSGITASVSDLSGKYTSLQSTVNGLTLTSSDNGDTSTITLSANGAAITSANITLKGEVTFQALQDRGYITTGTIDTALSGKGYVTESALAGNGTTTINGGNITTGIIKGVTYYAAGVGDSFIVTDYNHNRPIGGIRYDFVDPDLLYADKMYLYTSSYFDGYSTWYPSIKIESAGNISVEASAGLIYMKAGEYITLSCGGNLTFYVTHYVNYSPVVTTWEFANGSLYKNGTKVL